MKLRLTGYTFDASAQTVVHASFSDITLAGIQMIVNVTDQIVIYNFADQAKGGTLSTDTLTLEYDTTSMSDTDELMILVEDGSATTAIAGTVELGATDNAVLDAIAASVAAIDTDTTTLIGHVDGIETLIGTTNTTLGTIDTDTGNISTKIDTLAGAVAGTEVQVDVLTMPTTTVTATDLDIRALVNTDVVTAELSAVDNAVLDTIDAVLDTINAKLVSGTDIGDVTINNASGASAVNIQDGGNTITVDGTVAVTGVATAANQTTMIGHLDGVEGLLGTMDADTGGILTATQLIDDAVFVDDADWTADTSKHMLAGAVTQVASTANTDGDTTPLTTNAHRELRVAIPETDLVTAGTAHTKKYYTNSGAVTDGIIWSPAAGKRWFVTDLIINVSAACTVTLEDDKAGGDEAVMKFELAANSGISHSFNTPWFSGEDAADLLITTSAGNVYVTVTGYEI